MERKIVLIPKKRFLLIFILFAAVLASAIAYLFVNQSSTFVEPATNSDSLISQQQASAELTGKIESRFMFSGTVVTARAVENEARNANGIVDWASVFSQFASFEPSKYKEWFIDMECPVTTTFIPYRTQVDNTIFSCPPSVLPELTKYITVANIANNHTHDQGDVGFTQTRQSLLDGGLQVVGNWDPRQKEDLCEVMGLTFSLETNQKTTEVELPIAVCAYHYFEVDPLPEELAVVTDYAKIMPVIGLMQVGVEYRPNADDKQIQVGRALIDAGADFVIGNSPHWVQNTEVYKDKLIVYSTGNFIFDQLDAETNRGLNVDVSLSAEYDKNIASWLELSSTCLPKQSKDDCFGQAKQRGLSKPKIGYSFDAVASSGGFRQITRFADPAVQAAVLERTNWAETLSALGQ